jgi:uncharacterized membrane protein
MFYGPTCPHCHWVISSYLPYVEDKYGDQLELLLVNAETEEGTELFVSALDWHSTPNELRGVPAVFIGDELLIGEQITVTLEAEIDRNIAAGGVDWPAIPGLAEALPQLGVQMQEARTVADMSIRERLALDPVGNSFALAVLVAMLVSVAVVAVGWFRSRPLPRISEGWRAWSILAVSAIGLAVALYLAYVETAERPAICGPVGDCNTVQQSSYAKLFGVLPIGVLGVVGYLVVLALWLWSRYGPDLLVQRTRWLLPATALGGTLFSIYLTFLEPFVIGAVCMWCVTSAVAMMLLLWLTGYAAGYAESHAAAEPAPPSSAEPDEAGSESRDRRRWLGVAATILTYAVAAVISLIAASAVVHVYKTMSPPLVMSVAEANRRAAMENAILVAGLVAGPLAWHLIRTSWRRARG